MQVVLILFCSLLTQAHSQENVRALLVNENQKEGFSGMKRREYYNFLTLKRKIHQDVKKFKDIAVCFRFNLLSYRGESRSSDIIVGQTSNHVEFMSGNREGIGSEYLRFSLNPVPPGNGKFIISTYPELVDKVILENGVHWIWPIYNEDVNANKWHSMCFGQSIENKRSFLVHNGKTQENVTQPQVWADVSRGFDTTMVEPYSSKYPLNRNLPNKESFTKHRKYYHGQTLFPNWAQFSGYFVAILWPL